MVASAAAQQLIPNTYNPWTASGSAAPAKRPSTLIETYIGADTGSANIGPWAVQASGLTEIQLVGLDIVSRAQTSVNSGSQSVAFTVDSFAALGTLNLGNLLGAGVAMGWQADLNFANFNWSSAPDYNLSFNFTAPSGLVSDVLDLGSSLSISVFDGANNLIFSASGGQLLNLLGITIGTDLNNSQVNLNFSGSPTATTGLTVRFEADSLVNTSLLGIGSNVTTFSNVSLGAVPEPTVPLMAGLGAISLIGLRRRARN